MNPRPEGFEPAATLRPGDHATGPLVESIPSASLHGLAEDRKRDPAADSEHDSSRAGTIRSYEPRGQHALRKSVRRVQPIDSDRFQINSSYESRTYHQSIRRINAAMTNLPELTKSGSLVVAGWQPSLPQKKNGMSPRHQTCLVKPNGCSLRGDDFI